MWGSEVVGGFGGRSNASWNRITEITRRDLIDLLTAAPISWSGRLTEVEFLNRLYNLDALPSTDDRYETAAADIYQHRVNNYDWADEWVFYDPRFNLERGPDEQLLRFIAEMLHPAVIRAADEAAQVLGSLNELLRPDGWELVSTSSISGRPIYHGQRRDSFHAARPDLRLDQRPVLTDTTVLHEHLDRIEKSVGTDPGGAIGSSKNLVESLLKIILEGCGVEYARKDDLPKLYRKVADVLALNADSVPSSKRGSQSTQMILRSLTATVHQLGELRNELGWGHGRNSSNPALERHARLALNAAVTITEFLVATWQDRSDAGLLPVGSRTNMA